MVVCEKLIDLKDLNERIRNVQLSKRDSGNRPKDFKIRKTNSKYEGNAGSIRILSRIIPYILSDEIEESRVGEVLLKSDNRP